MIVKVIIKRDIIEGMAKDFFDALKQIRVHAMNQEGYISGETLICAENTNKVLIVSTWESLDAWNKWKSSRKRLEIDQVLSRYQVNPTVYEPYVFSKYRAAATLGFPKSLQKQDHPTPAA